jgi:hypothetical protein
MTRLLVRASRTLMVAATLLLAPTLALADPVLDWNQIMVATLASQNPFAQGRFAAITQLAVFEAVNTITNKYEPYLGTISAPAGASADAAAITAAHRVLKNYFPASAATLDTARANSLAAIPDGTAKDDGVAVGEAAAAAMIVLRASDGSAPPQFFLPSSAAPGEWQLTPSCAAAGGILLHWRNVTPFGIPTSDAFRSDPPPTLTSSEYEKDYAEVKAVGSAGSTLRPQDRSDVARFYNAVLAVGTWNPTARQVAAAQGRTLSQNARTFALLNMAISDGLVAVMETKYHYTLWRPETAIRNGNIDGNPNTDPDFGFVPFITTPCFPSYGSAHAAASYAARGILQRILGAAGHSIVLSSAAVPGVVLAYSSFKQITDDIDDARVYGGIHFRFDQEAGAKQGGRIAAYIQSRFLRPLSDGDE